MDYSNGFTFLNGDIMQIFYKLMNYSTPKNIYVNDKFSRPYPVLNSCLVLTKWGIAISLVADC